MLISITCWATHLIQCIRLRMLIGRYIGSLRQSRISSLLVCRNSASSKPIPVDSPIGRCVFQSACITEVKPMVKIDLRNWTAYLACQDFNPTAVDSSDSCYILLEADSIDDQSASSNSYESQGIPANHFFSPVAWKSGAPFGIIGQCCYSNLKNLLLAFCQGPLLLEDNLSVRNISTIDLCGHAVNLLRLSSTQGSLERTAWSTNDNSIESPPYKGSNESLACPSSTDIIDDDSPDTVQEFCDELADVNFQFETDAGEALSGSLEELAPEVLSPKHSIMQKSGKPPNVLIYCGKKDSARHFSAVCSVFKFCLHPDKYVLYHLKHEDVLSAPWQDNTLLLIIANDKVYDGVDKAFLQYFLAGGSLISFGSYFDKLFVERLQVSSLLGVLTFSFSSWSNIHAICGRHVYENTKALLSDVKLSSLAVDETSKKSILLEAFHENTGATAILTQIHLDKDPSEMAINSDVFSALKQANPSRFSVLKELLERLGLDCSAGTPLPLTPLYLMSQKLGDIQQILKIVQQRLDKNQLLRSSDISLKFITDQAPKTPTEVKAECIPVYSDQTSDKFNFDEYSKYLKTRKLGQVVFFADVVTSTMSIFDSWMFCLPSDLGVAAVASHQTSGVGRGGNAWLSPAGCAMFSAHVSVPLISNLGQRIAYMQHISSLAVVLAVCSLPGYEDLDLRIKWPNDIYYGAKMKLGGVLVKSSLMLKDFHCNIGCGVNVSNRDPTICINDLVAQHNIQHGTSLAPISTEQLIASAISHVESLVELFINQGKEAFLPLYYDKWLHSDVEIKIQQTDSSLTEATIIGLDDFGYLFVCLSDGSTKSVHPDGNSFDMMKNLIVPKIR